MARFVMVSMTDLLSSHLGITSIDPEVGPGFAMPPNFRLRDDAFFFCLMTAVGGGGVKSEREEILDPSSIRAEAAISFPTLEFRPWPS